MTRLLALTVCLAWIAAPVAAQTKPADSTAKIRALRIETGAGAAVLAGRDAVRQLLVTGETEDGRLIDLTHEAKYTATPANLCEIAVGGLVRPIDDGANREGKVTVQASARGQSAETTIEVTSLVNDPLVSFPNLVVPVFTKFGCNSGGCHGKADGQNNFKLSLLGFEPADDYDYLVKEARGRRLFPASPDQSLLLRKAVGSTPHGGGKRLEFQGPHYRIVRRWIEQGMPYVDTPETVVQRIEVIPAERVLNRGASQQLTVLAHLGDGSTQDVTRLAQLEPNVPEMAEVSTTGLVKVNDVPGAVAVMARYQSHVAVFTATVPLGVENIKLPPAKNYVDELVFSRLKTLGLPASELCDDSTFIRRATLDIAGRLPSVEETQAFLADKDEKKYDKLIDRLLDSPDYADYFTNKWSAILRNRRTSDKDDAQPTIAFHGWIREQLQKNIPYDQFVRSVLTSSGKAVETPPVVWYREVNDVFTQLEDTSQLFLGQRIGCARCHHHPYEKWSQDDYYSLAAFFTQVEVKQATPPKKGNAKRKEPDTPGKPFEVSLKKNAPSAENPKTGEKRKPAGLGAEPLEMTGKDDAREKLVDWMVEKDNPFFAKSLANRYWKHFFGRGLVEPEDDMRATNPPTNPALLDALAEDFAKNNYDLKHLVRSLCTSNAYRLSAEGNEHNAGDNQNYSRFLPKRLNAEVLLDAIDVVTGVKTQFKGVEAGTRAVQLPDNQFASYFLSVFGRPDSSSACECERSSAATLAQCVHMFNSKEILGKVSSGSGRAAQLAKDKQEHAERITVLYRVALSRDPSADELRAIEAYIEKHADDGQRAYEDVVWALINSKEFLFNH